MCVLQCQDEERGTCSPSQDSKTSAATDHPLPNPPPKPHAPRISTYTPATEPRRQSDALSANERVPQSEIASRRGSEPLALSDENSWELYQRDEDTECAVASESGRVETAKDCIALMDLEGMAAGTARTLTGGKEWDAAAELGRG